MVSQMTRITMKQLAACMLTLAMGGPVAAVQIQDLVRLKGSETNKIVGIGLVVGLPGTGDGGKFMPAMRPLAAVVQQLIDPNVVATELANAKNVALVALTATLPATGVREGDHVDVHVSAIGPASGLTGGRLFPIPMTGPLPGSPIFAFAEGAIMIERGRHTHGGCDSRWRAADTGCDDQLSRPVWKNYAGTQRRQRDLANRQQFDESDQRHHGSRGGWIRQSNRPEKHRGSVAHMGTR